MLEFVFDAYKLPALVRDCQLHGVGYTLGAKAEPLAQQASHIMALDCSGFVRWALYHASIDWNAVHPKEAKDYYPLVIPDGSVTQHDWCDTAGMPKGDFSDGNRVDGVLRIAFLTPKDGGGVGHVMLILNGYTLESHGHVGPDRRKWLSQPFMTKCTVYQFGRTQ